jgi:hypothetical protein
MLPVTFAGGSHYTNSAGFHQIDRRRLVLLFAGMGSGTLHARRSPFVTTKTLDKAMRWSQLALTHRPQRKRCRNNDEGDRFS